jgi:hypothetical protein
VSRPARHLPTQPVRASSRQAPDQASRILADITVLIIRRYNVQGSGKEVLCQRQTTPQHRAVRSTGCRLAGVVQVFLDLSASVFDPDRYGGQTALQSSYMQHPSKLIS